MTGSLSDEGAHVRFPVEMHPGVGWLGILNPPPPSPANSLVGISTRVCMIWMRCTEYAMLRRDMFTGVPMARFDLSAPFGRGEKNIPAPVEGGCTIEAIRSR